MEQMPRVCEEWDTPEVKEEIESMIQSHSDAFALWIKVRLKAPGRKPLHLLKSPQSLRLS